LLFSLTLTHMKRKLLLSNLPLPLFIKEGSLSGIT
jgi:hypothetical protein